jgi:hypothetical protein
MADLPAAIFRHWVHSREEDAGEVTVYRPSGFQFPPARGRDGIELRVGGDLVRHGPGPTDRSAASPGRWRALSSTDVELQFEDAARTSKRFSVIEVNDRVLKLKWLG